MSKSFEMDQNLYEKCVIYIQVHSGEDVKFDLIFNWIFLFQDLFIYLVTLLLLFLIIIIVVIIVFFLLLLLFFVRNFYLSDFLG